jgi:hypothetical protein
MIKTSARPRVERSPADGTDDTNRPICGYCYYRPITYG